MYDKGGIPLMAMSENRLSTEPVLDTYIPPDGYNRSLLEDREMGPVAIGDNSQGLFYQEWWGSYDGGTDDITLAPQIQGSPVVVLNVPDLTEFSFCFDNNGNITIAYMSGGTSSLYWFDTQAGDYVTTPSITGALHPMVSNDDKRPRQNQLNDVLLFYTKVIGPNHILHMRRQRDRYDVEFDLEFPCWPYVWKAGMHEGLRLQFTTLDAPPP
jgi:hypothetical protein